MTSRQTIAAGVLLLVSVTLATPVWAQSDEDIEAAREQFRLGNDAYNAGDYPTAIEHFQAANNIVPNARLDLYMGQAFINMGRSSEALQHIRAYADSSPQARAEVADVLQELENAAGAVVDRAQHAVNAAYRLAAGLPPEDRDPTRDFTGVPVVPIQVRSTPSGADVYVDDESLGPIGRTPLDTELFVGPHHIIVKLPYHETYRERVNVTRSAGPVPIVTAHLERRDVEVNIRFNPVTARATYVGADGSTVNLGMGSFSGSLPAGEGVFIIQRSGQSRRVPRELSAEGGAMEFTLNLNPDDDIRQGPPQLGTLTIRSDQARVRITVDGVLVGEGVGDFEAPQTPGVHTIRVTRDGYESVEDTIEIYEGERLSWRVPRLNRR